MTSAGDPLCQPVLRPGGSSLMGAREARVGNVRRALGPGPGAGSSARGGALMPRFLPVRPWAMTPGAAPSGPPRAASVRCWDVELVGASGRPAKKKSEEKLRLLGNLLVPGVPGGGVAAVGHGARGMTWENLMLGS